ncbi:hypothetical protein MW887_005708 [Aspergillus wentii]|nr:hypothetical protein MW887_005708 [Aspergillus wentii]
MASVPAPPFVHVEGMSNFRSIGGYPLETASTNNHRSTRQGFAFRSADPTYVTQKGLETILSLDITRAFDLRSLEEAKAQRAKLQAASGCLDCSISQHMIHQPTPLFPDGDWSPEAAGERYLQYAQAEGDGISGYVEVYGNMLEEGWMAIREILLHVRDRPTEAFLCHCSAGKDRTGIVIAVLLKVAGCSDDLVCREYELTEIGLARRREFVVQHLLKKPEMNGSRELAERVAGARYENMKETLEMVQTRYGGMRGYCKEICGLTDEDLSIVQGNLTSPESPIF